MKVINDRNGNFITRGCIDDIDYSYIIVDSIDEVIPYKNIYMAIKTIPNKFKDRAWYIDNFKINSNYKNNKIKKIDIYNFNTNINNSEDFEINIEDIKLEEIANNIKEYSIKLQLYFNKQRYELKQCVLKIQDIRHKIENTNLSASKGYVLCKMLQEYLHEKRKIKNDLEKCVLLLKSVIIQTNNIDKELEGIDNRTDYKPRVLDDLFDD